MSRTRVPNPGAGVSEEVRERNYKAQKFLSVLLKGFAGEMEQCYTHEDAQGLLDAMNEKLPPAIREARDAYEAYAPYRRRRRMVSSNRKVVN